MSFETVLSIAGVALSLGGLVPAVWPKAAPGRTIFVVTLSSLLVLSCFGTWRAIEHRREIEFWSSEVMGLLGVRPHTLEQLNQRLPHPPFSVLTEAVDDLVRTHQIRFEPVTVYDSESAPRTEYTVAVYSVTRMDPISSDR